MSDCRLSKNEMSKKMTASSSLLRFLGLFGVWACSHALVTPAAGGGDTTLTRGPFVRSVPTSMTPRNKPLQHSALLAQSGEEALDDMSEERRQNLFQALLRDLQIEEVPVLGCDADQVNTMSAALWTTMAELSDQDDEQRVCLVMEKIPIGALKAFCDDFMLLKTQQRLTDFMPEVLRISVSVVGKGAGPAVLVETDPRTPEEVEEKNYQKAPVASLDEPRCTSAMKSFVNRVVVGLHACPYAKDVEMATVGPIGYRFSDAYDACGTLSAFWNSVCELYGTPADVLSTTVLSLPAVAAGLSPESHARFSAISELVSRSLCLFRGDAVFSLVHFHPAYERNLIHPLDKPAYGQLPPQSWLPAMLRMNGNMQEADSMTEDDYFCSNYQRRAPHFAINILRVQQLEETSGPQSIVDLDLGNGVFEKASGIATYSRNAITLASIGEDTLEAEQDAEIAMQY